MAKSAKFQISENFAGILIYLYTCPGQTINRLGKKTLHGTVETQSWPCNKCSREFKKEIKKIQTERSKFFPLKLSVFGCRITFFSKENYSVENSEHFDLTKELQKSNPGILHRNWVGTGPLEFLCWFLIYGWYCVPT